MRPPFEFARAPVVFAGPVRDAILILKYGFRVSMAEPLGRLMAHYLYSEPYGKTPPDVLIPVPLHPSRFRERGFNQSAALTRVISSHTGLPSSENALIRTRRTRPQASLKVAERRKNVEGAFAVQDVSLVNGKRVVLVDDVLTTLFTVTECSRALRDAGAKSVWVLGASRDIAGPSPTSSPPPLG